MRWHFGVETLLAAENNILQHKHRQHQEKQKNKKQNKKRELGAWTTELACHLSMHGLLDTSSSDCLMQTTTQTDKQQTETKVVPVFGRLFTALWQRRNWTLWWEPCRLVGSHSSSMHTPCLHLHFAVPNIAACADHASEKETQTTRMFSVCVIVSHCSVAEEALDPFVGTMLSRCQSALTCLCLPCSCNRHVALNRTLTNTLLCATHRGFQKSALLSQHAAALRS